MGTHADFHITRVLHHWKARAKAAEAEVKRLSADRDARERDVREVGLQAAKNAATIARIRAEIDYTEQQLDDDAGLDPVIMKSAAFTTIRSILMEPKPPAYR